MGEHYDNARSWVEGAADLSTEQLECAIERLAFYLKDGQGLTEAVRADASQAIKYLNNALAEFTGTSTGARQETESVLGIGCDSAASLDHSPLGEPPSDCMSESQGQACVAQLLSEGLLLKGMRPRS